MKALALGLALSVASLSVRAESTVPFHALIDTHISQTGLCGPVGPNGPSCIVIDIEGTGNATHMGRVTIDGPSQINFITLAQTGVSVITAPDGSTITARFPGSSFRPDPRTRRFRARGPSSREPAASPARPAAELTAAQQPAITGF